MAKGYISIPVGYRRVDNQPLELNTIFPSLEEAIDYASNDPTAYAGQRISVVLPTVVCVYSIQPDKSLVLISSKQIIVSAVKSPKIIEHGRGEYPVVSLLTTDKTICDAQVTYIDENSLRVEWVGDFAGFILIHN